jgi:hypothetical protein
MTAEALTFALFASYAENRAWLDWAASHVGSLMQAWAASMAARIEGRREAPCRPA